MIKSKLRYMLNWIINNKWLFVVTLFLVLFFVDDVLALSDRDFAEKCNKDNFDKKYGENATCWSCNIIYSLLTAFLDVAEKLYGTILELCEVIVPLGGAIWIAVFFLKSLGSLAAQDPMKIMDGLFIFMFKWAFVYALLLAGIDELIGMVVSPILSIGFDIGTTFTSGVK